MGRILPLLAALTLLSAPSALALDGWLSSRDDGLAAAKESGKPVLVLTAWKDGVRGSCDAWRAQVATDEGVVTALGRFEKVEWLYDGPTGTVIPWTKQHGGTSDDPSCQAFVLHADGRVLARGPDRAVAQAGPFAKWLAEQADAYEKRHPRTRVPFVRGELVDAREDGEAPVCRAARRALGDGRPVLLYFGRDPVEDPTRTEKKEIKASRKFERGTLDSRKAAEAAGAVTLLRFDLGDERSAAYAASFGVRSAPALVLLHGAADGPEVLKRGLSGPRLASHLARVTAGG